MRLPRLMSGELKLDVSIHAPIRVRRGAKTHPQAKRSFNPRTHTGATLIRSQKNIIKSFQSTHPYGCDRQPGEDCAGCAVSIHAPIRVRPHVISDRCLDCCFNPRTHTGATRCSNAGHLFYWVSIHAPIRVRHWAALPKSPTVCFNPRTHTGATPFARLAVGCQEFQSTHPYGCDVAGRLDRIADEVSIHAPIRVRRMSTVVSGITSGFNPRTHTGATRILCLMETCHRFQSTHPYGCDARPSPM